jgi:hypothetical protein
MQDAPGASVRPVHRNDAGNKPASILPCPRGAGARRRGFGDPRQCPGPLPARRGCVEPNGRTCRPHRGNAQGSQALGALRDGPSAVPIVPKTGRNRPDSAAHRCLGSIGRKFFADRLALAYLGAGAILPRHGNCLDHPVETPGEMDGRWSPAGAAALIV